MNKRVLIVLSIVIFSGCGGDSDVNTDTAPDTTTSLKQLDGLYANTNDLLLMIVDSKRKEVAIMLGNYRDGDIFLFDSHSLVDNTVTTKGLKHFSGSNSLFHHDPELETTIRFDEKTASISGIIEDQNFLYSFIRLRSLEWSLAVGTHTGLNGTVWDIKKDGSFIINGACIVTGKMVNRDFYFAAENIQAANCGDNKLNGDDYQGWFVISELQGDIFLSGAMYNQKGILSDYIHVTP
ncbi:hypothetical protein L1D52_11900 [Vibrio brasiliensis]|uniref:hypothetical protein n=1 Tax=Vibrio brasiliensis TaxID=170652 RepID=UPI001EFC8A3C|nr:hypothetical protein [Vibrio brasiliensis]MCG9783057.1 hypothetical protein [Vibrio brasiliensis]